MFSIAEYKVKLYQVSVQFLRIIRDFSSFNYKISESSGINFLGIDHQSNSQTYLWGEL